MEDMEDMVIKTMHLKNKHIDFLNNINKNHSRALRTILDSVINGQEQKNKLEMISNKINWIAFGVFFLMLQFIVDNQLVKIFCLLMGVGFITMTFVSIKYNGGKQKYEISKRK